MTERRSRAEARREAAPAALVALVVLVGLSGRQPDTRVGARGPALVDLALLALPASAGDRPLAVARRAEFTRSRRAALTAFLVAGNFAALGLLVTGLVTASTATLSGEELLLTVLGSGRRT